MPKQVKQPKKPNYEAYCFECKKKITSDEPIVHKHSLMINDHLKLTSIYTEGVENVK